ncbi:MAG TPA: hypothetical protein VFK19_05160 [Sphingomicrobium sp.]|nr:hypothetical protein [Sphingomicrobium sp.]
MTRTIAVVAALLLFGGCQKSPEQLEPINEQNAPAPVVPTPSAPANEGAPAPVPAPAPSPPEPGTPGGLPDDRTPLPEPKGPIDPKSAEAAGQVVQHYGALIEQKRFAAAEKLWGHAATAKQQTAELERYSEAHLQIGKPTDMEGAAGSIYITVPVVLYGTLDGKNVHRKANVILRRVNDVPGSTEAQRRWHIERIEWSES